MFDARLRPLIDPVLGTIARRLARAGIGADGLTIAGATLGLAGAALVPFGLPLSALALFLAGRILDGLDGAVAGQTRRTDRGAFLDVALDFLVYAAYPLAFAVADPARNALAAACLLAAFLADGAAFLAFAALAAKRGLETRAQGLKSLYYLSGLAEGAETIAVFALACLVPEWFPVLAYAFAAICAVSAAARILIGCTALADQP